jgi:hypothetical protein
VTTGATAAAADGATKNADTAALLVSAINATSATSFVTASNVGAVITVNYAQYFGVPGAVAAEVDADNDSTQTFAVTTAGDNAGADTISGGVGADTIIGGTGADVMTGGTGTDAFIYTATGQTGAVTTFTLKTLDTTTLDRLTVVNADNDTINLSALTGDIDALTAVTTAVADGATLGATGAVRTYTGTWTGGVFTSTAVADATSLLVVYDNDGAGGGTTYEAIVLIGVTAAAITDGIITI